jgi:hypothetical protein
MPEWHLRQASDPEGTCRESLTAIIFVIKGIFLTSG